MDTDETQTLFPAESVFIYSSVVSLLDSYGLSQPCATVQLAARPAVDNGGCLQQPFARRAT
jgi:hypothetical protein